MFVASHVPWVVAWNNSKIVSLLAAPVIIALVRLSSGCCRYVRYMQNIRWIQDYLVRKADKHLLPKVENTNIDRSVGVIHLTIMG